jgi:hypothetical protein
MASERHDRHRAAVASPKEVRKALARTGQARAGSAVIRPLPDTERRGVVS